MTKAFLEMPEHLQWKLRPGSNRPLRDPESGGFLEVVKVHPFPAITGKFHLQVSPLREILRVEVHNSCPMLFIKEQMVGAISVVQFTVALYFTGAEYLPDFISSFKAYGWDLALYGRRNTLERPSLGPEHNTSMVAK